MKIDKFVETRNNVYDKTDRHPFNGQFSRTMWVSRHQKGYTSLNFNETADYEVAVASAGPYANHLHCASDRCPRQHLITEIFAGRMLFLTPTNSVKAG